VVMVDDDKGTLFRSQIYNDGASSPPSGTFDSKANTADKLNESKTARG